MCIGTNGSKDSENEMSAKLTVGSLANVWIGTSDIGNGYWYGSEVVEISEDGKLYAVKLLEASDPDNVGDVRGGFHAEPTADYFGESEPANIKPTDVYIVRSERPAGLSWLYRGEDCSVSLGKASLIGAVASMLEGYVSDVPGNGQEFPETPEAAASLLTKGRYIKKYDDGRQVQYWFKFSGQ
jgi:hypothetical protein